MHTPARCSKISALSQPPTSLLVRKQTLDVSPKKEIESSQRIALLSFTSVDLRTPCWSVWLGWHGREWNGMPKRDGDGDGIRMDAWTDADGRMEVPSLSLPSRRAVRTLRRACL